MVLKSIDRIMILKFLSTEDLGYYSIGLMGVSMLLYIPDSISYVLYPRMLAKFAATGDADATAREMVRPLATVAWIMPLIVGVAAFWVREVVTLVLPKYLPGVEALSILLFGTLGLALASIPSFYIMAIHKQVKLLPLALGAVVLDVTLIGLFLKLGWKLEGVAAGVSIGYVVYGVGLLVYAASHVAGSAARAHRLGAALGHADAVVRAPGHRARHHGAPVLPARLERLGDGGGPVAAVRRALPRGRAPAQAAHGRGGAAQGIELAVRADGRGSVGP